MACNQRHEETTGGTLSNNSPTTANVRNGKHASKVLNKDKPRHTEDWLQGNVKSSITVQKNRVAAITNQALPTQTMQLELTQDFLTRVETQKDFLTEQKGKWVHIKKKLKRKQACIKPSGEQGTWEYEFGRSFHRRPGQLHTEKHRNRPQRSHGKPCKDKGAKSSMQELKFVVQQHP